MGVVHSEPTPMFFCFELNNFNDVYDNNRNNEDYRKYNCKSFHEKIFSLRFVLAEEVSCAACYSACACCSAGLEEDDRDKSDGAEHEDQSKYKYDGIHCF